MPYIKEEDRRRYYDSIYKIVDLLLEKFPSEDGGDFSEGDLNYIISSIIWKLFDNRRSYYMANKLMGVLESVKQEFYRRKVYKYEDQKIKENGDL